VIRRFRVRRLQRGQGRRPQDDGAVSVVVAAVVASGLLFGVGALAVDLGNAFARQSSLQKTADLAALAAAQELPDLDAARAAAIATLCADANRPVGWPWAGSLACESDTGWATSADPRDPDTADGEIEFYTGEPDPATGRYPDTQLIGPGDGLAASAVRVVTPPAVVRFGLAAGLPGTPSSLNAQKAATATVRSPLAGGVLPFYLWQDDDPADGPVCVMELSPPRTPPDECPGASATERAAKAHRGFVNEPIDTFTLIQASLRANVKAGLNHPVHDFRYWPCGGLTGGAQLPSNGVCPTQNVPPAGTTCADPLASVVLTTFGTPSSWAPGIEINCLTVGVKQWSFAGPDSVQRSLFRDADARLRTSCSGQTAGVGHGISGNGFDATQLLDDHDQVTLPSELLDPSLSASQLAAAGAALAAGQPNPAGSTPLFSKKIFTCERLGLVPVLGVDAGDVPVSTNTHDVTFPVVGFRFAWLGGTDSDNGIIWEDDRIDGVRLLTIDPSYFPPTPPLTGDLGPLPISDNLPGPKTIRLIHDAADPSS
jgi:hypothetical protein